MDRREGTSVDYRASCNDGLDRSSRLELQTFQHPPTIQIVVLALVGFSIATYRSQFVGSWQSLWQNNTSEDNV